MEEGSVSQDGMRRESKVESNAGQHQLSDVKFGSHLWEAYSAGFVPQGGYTLSEILVRFG